jgi:hypothetical protein
MTYPILPATTLAAAVTGSLSDTLYVTRPFQSALIAATFAYGADGTTCRAWVQCSADRGTTWYDVCNFYFQTTAAKAFFNISGLTAVTSIGTPTDGTASNNASVDGTVTNTWRVKYTTTGTYSGASSLTIWVHTRDT